jgi:thiol-disulfide isomerase/thioredoxin
MLFDGHPVELNRERFRRHTKPNDVPVIADFWPEWCGPCRAMASIFKRAAQELEPKARFVRWTSMPSLSSPTSSVSAGSRHCSFSKKAASSRSRPALQICIPFGIGSPASRISDAHPSLPMAQHDSPFG